MRSPHRNAIKVLVVDDSAFFRTRLTRCFDAEADIEVVGTAVNGRMALPMVDALRPAIVTMDVDMPVMNGIEAVRALVDKRPVPILMLSAHTRKGAETTLEALDAGATDFLTKETDGSAVGRRAFEREIVERVRAMATGRGTAGRVRHAARDVEPLLERAARGRGSRKAECVLIGASTGGPPVVSRIIEALPTDFGLPVIVAQHMPEAFTECFAQRLDRRSRLEVKLGEHGDLLQRGQVFIAPGGVQTRLRRDGGRLRLVIENGPAEARYRPSIDTTFRSAAESCGARVLAVVLTGMGDDGRHGGELLKRAGAVVWAQDEPSCVVFGMPRAVIEAGLADAVLAPDAIARRLVAAS